MESEQSRELLADHFRFRLSNHGRGSGGEGGEAQALVDLPSQLGLGTKEILFPMVLRRRYRLVWVAQPPSRNRQQDLVTLRLGANP